MQKGKTNANENDFPHCRRRGITIIKAENRIDIKISKNFPNKREQQ